MPFRLSFTRLPTKTFVSSTTSRPNWAQGLSLYGYQRLYSESSTKQPLFSYHLAAAASGKTSRLNKAEYGNNFWTQSYLQQEPSSFSSIKSYSGEDAFFMSRVAKSNRHVVFGLADGVGGWQDQGVDPSHFSHGLCRYMAEATYRPENETSLRPVNVLQKGYDMVQADKKIVAGGSTASLATAQPDGQMEVANLGDSGFVILSPGKVSYKSEPQTHGFNTPFQLSKLTPRMQSQRAIFGGATQISEAPSAADTTHHTLRHGDVALFASDGVWDNLDAMEVFTVVSTIMEKEGHWAGSADSASTTTSVNDDLLRISAQRPSDKENADKDLAGRLAFAVAKEAKVASHNDKRDGPFAKEVHKHFPGEEFNGGKVDDICVVVCIAIQDAGDAGKIKAKL